MRRWRLFLVLRVYARLLRKWRSSVEPPSSRRSPLLDPKSRHGRESGLLRCGARSPGRRMGHGFRRVIGYGVPPMPEFWIGAKSTARVSASLISPSWHQIARKCEGCSTPPSPGEPKSCTSRASSPSTTPTTLAPLYATRMAIMSRRSATRRRSGRSVTVQQFGALATPLGPTVITRPWPLFATPLGPTATSRGHQLSDFRLAHFVSIISSLARSRHWRASAVCLLPPERRCPWTGDGERSRFLLLS